MRAARSIASHLVSINNQRTEKGFRCFAPRVAWRQNVLTKKIAADVIYDGKPAILLGLRSSAMRRFQAKGAFEP